MIRSPLVALLFLAACDGGSSEEPPPDAAPEPLACSAKPVGLPTATSFTDVSLASGIQVNNFIANPLVAIPINDHSRLGFADINGDGCDDIVAHDLFPNPKGGIPYTHLVFQSGCDGTFRDVSAASGLRDVQAGFFAFADVDNDGDQDCFAGLDIPLPGLTSSLWLNDGSGTFTRKAASGIEGTANATTAGSALRRRVFTISTLAPTGTASKTRTTSHERIRMQP